MTARRPNNSYCHSQRLQFATFQEAAHAQISDRCCRLATSGLGQKATIQGCTDDFRSTPINRHSVCCTQSKSVR